MRCYNCGKTLKKKTGRYHYTESGLPNVYLDGITIYYCSCGEVMPEIPCIEELHERLARDIAENSPRLTGPEIRFLRKHLELKPVDFAKLLGVSKVTVSRWEHNKVKIDKAYEGIIRALVKSKEFRSVLENVTEKRQSGGSHRYVIDAKSLVLSCA
ncbi:MAG: helix-turn-helix domain-containing protein [bacterium]